jgi:Tfp pilus assembly protein PilX
MTRFGTIWLCWLGALTASHAAESLIAPGEWKVTSTTVVNGVAQPTQSKSRCITAEQAQDLAKTFGPVSGTINSTCADPQIESSGRTLTWRLQCRGQLDADVAGKFIFDSPQHYTAMVVSQGRMAGTLISDVKTGLEGERVGDCEK